MIQFAEGTHNPKMAEVVVNACYGMMGRGAPTQYDDIGFNKMSFHSVNTILKSSELDNEKLARLCKALLIHKKQVANMGYEVEAISNYKEELENVFPFIFSLKYYEGNPYPSLVLRFPYKDEFVDVTKLLLNNYYNSYDKSNTIPAYSLGVLADEMEKVYPGFTQKMADFLHANGVDGRAVKNVYGGPDGLIEKAKAHAIKQREIMDRYRQPLTVTLLKTKKMRHRFGLVLSRYDSAVINAINIEIPDDHRDYKRKFDNIRDVNLIDDKCYYAAIQALRTTNAKIDNQIEEIMKPILEATKDIEFKPKEIKDIAPFIEIAETYRELRPGKRMFDHQVEGIAFALANESVILADDMGLGKSLQATMAANHLSLKEEYHDCPILVICPASLRVNWMREIFKWLGSEAGPVQIVSATKTRTFFKDETTKKARKGDGFLEISHPRGGSHKHYPKKGISKHAKWVIINYDILMKMRKDIIKWVKESGCKIMIADEAHYLKNPDSQRSRAVFGFREKFYEDMETGEVMKRLPKGLTEEEKKGYKTTTKARPGIYKNIPIIMPLTGTPITSKNADLFPLAKLIRHEVADNKKGFYMRYCAQDLGGRYGKNYDGSNNTEELIERLSTHMLQRMKHNVLDLPDKMRQYKYVDIDIDTYWEKWAEYVNTYFDRTGKEFNLETAMLTELNVLRNVASQLKVDQIIEFSQELVDKDKKVIIFTGYTKTADRFEEHFSGKCIKIVGGMTDAQRDKAVQDFQNNPDIKVAVCNIKAAGVGLTLTSATEVIMADLQWLPSDHFQAEDRSYRIGQDKNVFIYYFIANETHEVAVKEVLDEKAKLIDAMEKKNYEVAGNWQETVQSVMSMMRNKSSELGMV